MAQPDAVWEERQPPDLEALGDMGVFARKVAKNQFQNCHEVANMGEGGGHEVGNEEAAFDRFHRSLGSNGHRIPVSHSAAVEL